MKWKISARAIILLLLSGYIFCCWAAAYEERGAIVLERSRSGSTDFVPSGYDAEYTFSCPCYSWGDGTDLADKHTQSCNCNTGAVGAWSSAWVGGATAEAMQRVDFYVGRTKYINVEAEIVRMGGKATFGIGAFGGTEKTWSYDDFSANYDRADIDPPFGYEDAVMLIIDFVSLAIGLNPSDIAQAISFLSLAADVEYFAYQMQEALDEDNAEIINISFGFMAYEGNHTVWAGLRSNASACLTGTAVAVNAGQVTRITIDGIAEPAKPDIEGPSWGETDQLICSDYDEYRQRAAL